MREITQKDLELAKLHLPDESTQELEERWTVAEDDFARAQLQGRVIDVAFGRLSNDFRPMRARPFRMKRSRNNSAYDAAALDAAGAC